MTSTPHPDDAPPAAKHRLRWILIGTGAALLIIGALLAWQYPKWRANRSVSMAREWLDAGKLELAEPAVFEALRRAPLNPDAWVAASELAGRTGQPGNALLFAAKASDLSPANAKLALDWATTALLVRDTASAEKAITRVASADSSARAQLLLAELARLKGNLAVATQHLENALRLGGPMPEYELPLADALFRSADTAARDRARALYEKYRKDPVRGAVSLRTFLLDAMSSGQFEEASRIAVELLAHPARSEADQDNALLTLSLHQPGLFRSELAKLQAAVASDIRGIDHLLAWLTGHRHHALVADWLSKLPSEITQQPPVAVQYLEHLRINAKWPEIQSITATTTWEEQLEFLRQAYAAFAAQKIGQRAQAEVLWSSLRSQTEIKPGGALFLAGTLYSWGEYTQAVELWWQASQQAGLAIQALGSLARHYQVTRDPAGSLRAFRQLHTLRTDNDEIANNYLYYSTLLEPPGPALIGLARALHERNSDSLSYTATYAFVLLRANRAAEALAVLTPRIDSLKDDPALRITCGLVLAANGQKAQAAELLQNPPASLTNAELALIDAALR